MPGTTRSALKKVAEKRIREAEILYEARQYAGAYYLAGYAIECGLKACLAKEVRRSEFPSRKWVQDAWTHDLSKLMKQARLAAELRNGSNQLRDCWSTVLGWNEHKRYEPSVSRKEAGDLILAVTDPNDGVLKWLRAHW